MHVLKHYVLNQYKNCSMSIQDFMILWVSEYNYNWTLKNPL